MKLVESAPLPQGKFITLVEKLVNVYSISIIQIKIRHQERRIELSQPISNQITLTFLIPLFMLYDAVIPATGQTT